MIPGAPLEKRREESSVRVAEDLVLPETGHSVVRAGFASRMTNEANAAADGHALAAADSAAREVFVAGSLKVKEASAAEPDRVPAVAVDPAREVFAAADLKVTVASVIAEDRVQPEAADLKVREVFVVVGQKEKEAIAGPAARSRSVDDRIAQKVATEIYAASVRPMVRKILGRVAQESIPGLSGQSSATDLVVKKESHVRTSSIVMSAADNATPEMALIKNQDHSFNRK